jgi:hypothetical protein
MSHPAAASSPAAPEDRQEFLSAMFASMVMQQTNMASIFLGLGPNPQTGQIAQDLEHARYFIDQLEMLEAKTRGNLSKQEEGLLRQSLTSLRMAFVEAVSQPDSAAQPDEKATPPPAAIPTDGSAKTSTTGETSAEPPEVAAADESKKKFTKKY